MAKEALFNILNNHIDFESVRVLDLFAGTGNISFEFASRGALEVIAVESNQQCIQFIRQMKDVLQYDSMVVVKADVFRFLAGCRTQFDVVFADPPYDMDGIDTIPDKVFSNNMIAAGGWLVIEHDSRKRFDSHPGFFNMRKYGKVHFSFFTTALSDA
jgi:16S rRNA (guanine966-N2)-methyltransferase